MKWRQANKIRKKFNRYRRSTQQRALLKGRFKTGYLGVYGTYSKRFPKGARRHDITDE